MPSSSRYVLPNSLRTTLKEPIGTLADGQTLLDRMKHETRIVSIGDQVTYTLLCNEIHPWICIIDYQIKRQKDDDYIKEKLKNYGDHCVQVYNPAGSITKELYKMIEQSYQNLSSNETLRMEVDGEEDLAALPAILLAPENVTIIYGLPDKGVVIVPSTEKHKQKVRSILNEM